MIYTYIEGQNWHKLGDIGAPGVREMYSALLSAQASGRPVKLRYPDGYNCQSYELSTSALMVRVE